MEVQPAQTNVVERVKRFVNVICIASSETWKGQAKFRRCPLWKNFCGPKWMHWFRLNFLVIKRGAVCFNFLKSFKNNKCQSCQFP